MKLVIGSDKSGFTLKEAIKLHLMSEGYEIDDHGTLDVKNALAFHQVANRIAREVQDKEYEKAILICGTGMGMSIVSNKFKGVYAACCESTYAAEKCRAINDANILTMGGWVIGEILGCAMADKFLNTEFTQDLEPWRAEWLKGAKVAVKEIEDDIY